MKNVCKEIEELQIEIKQMGYNISNIEVDQLEEVATNLLNKFNLSTIPVDIVRAAEIMGLELLKVKFKDNQDNHIGGALAVSSKLYEQGYKRDKVIKVNKYNSQGHQRFSIVHEIYHYIFDSFFRNKNQEYYDVFFEDNLNSKDINEKRANRFAAAFLMPKEEFIKEYLYLKVGEKVDDKNLYEMLAEKFLVSQTAVKMRIEELNLKEL